MNRFFLFLIFIILLFGIAIAQKQPPDEAKQEPIEVNGEVVEYFQEEKKVIAIGDVKIVHKGGVLTADKVTFYTETQDAIAEGNVCLVFDKNEFKSQKATYNFLTKKGIVLEPWMYVPPWYGRGKQAEQVSEKEFRIKDGYISTCAHDFPHYRIQSKKIFIYPDDKIVAKNIIFKIGYVPLLYLPQYTHSLKERKSKISLIAGKRADWGWYLLSAYRYNFTDNERGYLRLDYREKRDLASGFDYYYDSDLFGEGLVKFYYMHERFLRRDHLWTDSSEGMPTTEKQRYRTHFRHKWQIFDDTLLFSEVNQVTDEAFLKDYYERDYERDKQPPTYALITKTGPNYILSAQVQGRINEHENVVERLPDAGLVIPNVRIGPSKFYYRNESSFANLTKKFKDTSDGPSVNRTDSFNQLSYIMKLLGWLNVTPYVATRQTYYTRDVLNEEEPIRGIFYSGVDVSTKFYKIFDVQTNMLDLDIHKLRHIITPTVNYAFIHPPTVNREKLAAEFDSIDSISRKSIVTFGLENKLQTKRLDEKDLKSVDVARLILTTDYDFNHTPGGEFKDYKGDVQLKPYNWLGIGADATYDPHKHNVTVANLDLFATGKEKNFLSFSQRYLREGEVESVLEASYKISPKWNIHLYERFEWRGDIFKEHEYVITRNLHCWEVDVNFNDRKGFGRSIWVVFRLKDFPEIPFEFTKSYRRPKIQRGP